MTIINQPKNNK